jgi:hypothetical protein
MDMSALLGSLVDTFLNFWLNLVLDGIFNLLSDLLFGGSTAGLI